MTIRISGLRWMEDPVESRYVELDRVQIEAGGIDDGEVREIAEEWAARWPLVEVRPADTPSAAPEMSLLRRERERGEGRR